MVPGCLRVSTDHMSKTRRRYDGTKVRWDEGTMGRRYDGTKVRWDEGTMGRRDNRTKGRWDEGTSKSMSVV